MCKMDCSKPDYAIILDFNSKLFQTQVFVFVILLKSYCIIEVKFDFIFSIYLDLFRKEYQ